MKTQQQLTDARAKIVDTTAQAMRDGASTAQLALLSGITIALVWMDEGEHTGTMDRLLAGEIIKTDTNSN